MREQQQNIQNYKISSRKSKVRFMVVSLYAALLTIIYIALSVHVIRGRWFHRISLNDGGNEAMNRRIRAHGNFSEYVPLFLIILSLAEHNGMPAYAVHILGCLFILGRLLHAYNLLDLRGNKPHLFFRSAGIVLTILILGALSVILLAQFIIQN